MAIKKVDVLNADASHVQQVLVKYEAQADAQLEQSGEHTIRLESEPCRFQHVIGEELQRIYEDAGWTVLINIGSAQRDGDWYNVEIS